MAQINVNKRVQDPFYRYKMPRIIGKVEGRGNGIKTVLVNVEDVAKSLNVSPDYPTRYLGFELGACVTIDPKNNKYIINGAHVDKKLQDLVYDFIERYLLCPECRNPETSLSVISSKEKIKRSCQACGDLSFITNPHRFNTYILKHPPKIITVSIHRNTEPKSEDMRTSSPEAGCENGDSVNWSVDVTENAVKNRMRELTSKAAEMILDEDLEKTVQERLLIFQKHVSEFLIKFNDFKVEDHDFEGDEAINIEFNKLVHESKRLEVVDEAIIVTAEMIFRTCQLVERIKQFRALIAMLVTTHKAEMNLLNSIEMVLVDYQNELVPLVSKIFFCLYQLELVQEDTFLQWSKKKSKRYLRDPKLVDAVHKSAFGFINWLKTAEEESSEGDGEIEFVQEDQNPKDEYAAPSRHGLQNNIDHDEDINIDDI